MAETLYSVGIDIGTSTTQLVISRLTLEDRANPYSVPRVAITGREVLFRSAVHFTPLRSDTVIDAEGVRAIVEEEYRSSGFEKGQIATGAVIITGETARKENAAQVLESLAGYAGDFVVATAGPDLEAVLAARGAGADEYSRERGTELLNFDIGGGTSNLALYDGGVLRGTGCLNVGGRLVRLDRESREILWVSPVVERWRAETGKGSGISPGRRVTEEELSPLLSDMVTALEEAAGAREKSFLSELFQTEGALRLPAGEGPVRAISFSGGVADCIWSPPEEPFAYGDLGVLLGRAIRASERLRGIEWVGLHETIRATVVGAGSHATELSGSTIFYRGAEFPLKNLPLLKLTREEEQGDAARIAGAIREKLALFGGEGVALGLRGEKNPSYARVREIAQGIARGLSPLTEKGLCLVTAVETDMAKVLGQALGALTDGGVVCLDSVNIETGDYLDVGNPVSGGTAVPVVVKTLAFERPGEKQSEKELRA